MMMTAGCSNVERTRVRLTMDVEIRAPAAHPTLPRSSHAGTLRNWGGRSMMDVHTAICLDLRGRMSLPHPPPRPFLSSIGSPEFSFTTLTITPSLAQRQRRPWPKSPPNVTQQTLCPSPSSPPSSVPTNPDPSDPFPSSSSPPSPSPPHSSAAAVSPRVGETIALSEPWFHRRPLQADLLSRKTLQATDSSTG
jgi:hypothetical protein